MPGCFLRLIEDKHAADETIGIRRVGWGLGAGWVEIESRWPHGPDWRQPPRSLDLHVLLRVFPNPDPSLTGRDA
jgi:hypothetical protein